MIFILALVVVAGVTEEDDDPSSWPSLSLLATRPALGVATPVESVTPGGHRSYASSVESDDDRDLAAILSRRELLIAAALTTLHCSPASGDRPPAAATPVDSGAPPSDSAPSPSATADSSAPPPGPKPPPWRRWKDVVTTAPPLAAPTSTLVPQSDRDALKELEAKWRARYAEFGKAWDLMPLTCSITECEPQWMALHAAGQTHKGIAAADVPECLYRMDWGMSFGLRDMCHARFLLDRGAELLEGMRLLASSMQELASFNALFAPRGVTVRACLTCIVPETIDASGLLYERGEHQPSGSIDRFVSALQAKPSLRYVIRGHADANEGQDAMALSKARAESLKAALLERGGRASQMRTLALGDLVLVDVAGHPLNRRVEFARV